MSEPAQPAPPVLVISTHLPDRWWPVAAAVLLTGCAGSAHKSTHQPSTPTATANARPATPPPLGELLAVPAVGRIYGRCALGDRRWTIKFMMISQGTEPHIFRVNIKLTLAAAIGDTANCTLISSSLNATTYYPGGPPAS